MQDKVDVVKMTMQDNIQQMLANEERLDQISQNAESLNEQVRRYCVAQTHRSLRVLDAVEQQWRQPRTTTVVEHQICVTVVL